MPIQLTEPAANKMRNQLPDDKKDRVDAIKNQIAGINKIFELMPQSAPKPGGFKMLALTNMPGEHILVINENNKLRAYYTGELLGKGGFGQVFRGYSLESGNEVAVKIGRYKPEDEKEETENENRAIQRFKRKIDEFVFVENELDSDTNEKLLVIPYAAGKTLDKVIEESPSDEKKLLMAMNLYL